MLGGGGFRRFSIAGDRYLVSCMVPRCEIVDLRKQIFGGDAPYGILRELQTVSNAGEIKRFNAHSGDDATAVTFHLAKGIDIAQHIG